MLSHHRLSKDEHPVLPARSSDAALRKIGDNLPSPSEVRPTLPSSSILTSHSSPLTPIHLTRSSPPAQLAPPQPAPPLHRSLSFANASSYPLLSPCSRKSQTYPW